MRIRLKAAVIDVATGNWSVHAPEPFDSSTLSTARTRERKDQKQVERLKQVAYSECVRGLMSEFAPMAAK